MDIFKDIDSIAAGQWEKWDEKPQLVREFAMKIRDVPSVFSVSARDWSRLDSKSLAQLASDPNDLARLFGKGVLHIYTETLEPPAKIANLYDAEKVVREKFPDLHVLYTYGVPNVITSRDQIENMSDPLKDDDYNTVWTKEAKTGKEDGTHVAMALVPDSIKKDANGIQWVAHEQKPKAK